jgi:2-oxoglutarate dehydrogenase E2 component (dihydrolipoamide succinyltransferase)
MSHEIKIPSLGESINEVQIAEWLKAEGDTVKQDENIAVIDSEKTTLELPAPASGRLSKILHQAGETVKIGEVIAQIETAAAGPAESAKSAERPPAANGSEADTTKAASKTAATPAKSASAPDKAASTPDKGDKAASDPSKSAPKTKAKAAPSPGKPASTSGTSAGATAPTADEAVSDLGKTAPAQVPQPSKPSEEEAVEKPPRESEENSPAPAAEATEEAGEKPGTKEAAKEAKAAQKISAAPGPKPEPPGKRAEQERAERVVPMSMLRRTAARRLVEAKQQMAMLTTFNEVDLSAVQGLRKECQEVFQKHHQVKLGLMSFFVKAAVEALKQFPQLNAEVRDDNIIYRDYFDINVAIASERGLVVPVLRNAGNLGFAEVEKTIGDLVRRAEQGELKPAELAGGTFTITNGGVFGSLLSTPIINPPQTGILGMHTIQERPVAVQGQVVIRPMMYLALTYDHRAVDGREAVLFLRRVKEVIESPSRVLIEI